MHPAAQPSPDRGLSLALEDTVTRFAALVRRIGLRHGLSEGDVDEVMQEVRIRLWHARGTSEQIAGVTSSYVYRTACSAALDLLRRRRTRREALAEPLEHAPAGPLAAAGGPEHDLAEGELAEEVVRALATLAPSRRPVVRMYLAGYPREEIAALLGWTEAKTRNLLYRGLADLRAQLRARGVGVDFPREAAP
ncbi:MAG TPA: sigma-70 family RNA polymerase sigma factor [Gemmatimonadales bacterium]|nr:sigma-70 family RNA polymerase sigma factor [Gemmatimonadales bacterium]